MTILIYLLVQVIRNHREAREQRDSKVNLGLELSQATLY